MKKCLIYGNFQIDYIKRFLIKNSDFCRIYSVIETKKVNEIKEDEIPDLELMISDVDLFIHQPVSDNYNNTPKLGTNYLKSKLNPKCRIVSFPIAYFRGYYPEMIYLKSINNQPIKQNIYNYHDFNILSGFYQGQSVDDVVSSIYDNYFYGNSYIKNNLDLTITEMSKREASLDIKLSQFIIDNYKKINLFNTINQPHFPIIGYLVNNILEELGFSKQYTQKQLLNNNTLGYQNYFPIYPSVSKILNLQFENKLAYRFRKIDYSVVEGIKNIYNFYEQNKELVEVNIEDKWDRFYRKSSCFENSPIKSKSTHEINNLNLDINVDLSDLVSQLSDLSDNLKAQKQFSESIIIAKSVVDLKPKCIKYWHKLALLYEITEDFEQEIKCHKKILTLNPDHINTYINLGRVYYKQKCFEEAIRYYNHGISLDPQQPAWVYRFLGNCLQELGYLDDAIAKYHHVLSLPSYPPITYIELGNALRKQKRTIEAEKAYQKAIELNPQLSTFVKF